MRRRAALLLAALVTGPALAVPGASGARAADLPHPAWFIPPPPRPAAAGQKVAVDLRLRDGHEEITVTAPRQPAPPPEEHVPTPGFGDPGGSEAASPVPVPIVRNSYCQSAYHDVGGQPATGKDMLGGGGCD